MQCKHPDVVVLSRIGSIVEIESNRTGNYVSAPRAVEYYCHACGRKSKVPFGNLGVSPTASTQTHLASNISIIDKKMNNQEFLNNLNRVKSEVNKKKSDGQKLLEALRIKTKLEEEQKKQIIFNINETLNNQLENNYKNMDNALAAMSKKFEKIYNTELESAIADKLKNTFSSFEQTTIRMNDAAEKIQESSKKKANFTTPISRAILLINALFFRPTIDQIEIDGIKYVDVDFALSLDIDNGKLDFFGNDVKIVEWEEIPKQMFGLKSKIFGVKKNIKTLRITEEELIKRYEITMGSKIS